ncbi:hypothetical protein PROAA_200001 [Candidatus Propionivibrio aalborgensis]|uniref:Uncharacterized protein n=1 Tax=Candidatus Propionivibrio aalborgensis TaxID=1860101 RepID=A0A1A8XP44_9RHOO|nr:hypothetical protein PROAA_200001 [Candidatus Propionivibrio aalborgensis]
MNFNEDLGILGQISQQDMTERDPKGARESFDSFRDDLMGMNDLRDDVERVMRKNYPNSVYYTRGLERKEPWWKLW